MNLVDLPTQPQGVRWPVGTWPEAQDRRPEVDALCREMFADTATYGTTYATVVVSAGRLVTEHYGGQLEHFAGAPEPVEVTTPLLSWSMAKSMLHAAVGILVADGRLDTAQPAGLVQWSAPGDPRGAITIEQLLAMRDGLDFVEDYVDDRVSDTIAMLFGDGQADMAAFTADRPLAAVPGERFNYSSGTSNIVSKVVAGVVGAGDEYRRFLLERLFGPIGVTTATFGFDGVGTWVGSSYAYMTAQDFARFGLLYLRDGLFDGQRIVPEGWVDHGRATRSVDPTDGQLHGAHWWSLDDEFGTFWASGYDGQMLVLVPALDLIIVRLGKSPSPHKEALFAWRRRMIELFADQPPS